VHISYWKKIDLSTIDLLKFKRHTEQPYVPKEGQLDQLIAGAGWKTGAFCQMLKETGARTIEAAGLKWSDIDSSGHVVSIRNAAKNACMHKAYFFANLLVLYSLSTRRSAT
jgi:integrase